MSGQQKPQNAKPGRSKHPVAESRQFFDDFLRNKLQNIPELQPRRDESEMIAPVTPSKSQPIPRVPMTGRTTSSSLTSLTPSDASPKKRKQVEIVIDTPIKRRTGILDKQTYASEPSSTPVKSSSSLTTLERSATPAAKPKMQCYVEITTPKSWSTPVRQMSSKIAESSPDLGGYGTVEDDKYDSGTLIEERMRSMGKKTGDRDDRGESQT